MLSHRTALVTGGGRGIGREIAVRLAKAGARVAVTGRTQSEIDAVAAEIGGVAIAVDLGDRASITNLIAEVNRTLGKVDVLVNNAGIAESAPLGKTSDDMFDRTMAVNSTAPFLLMRAFVPGMVAQKWGRVVNIASIAALAGQAYTSAYCASKHALLGLTRATALEVAIAGVTVNAICPGWVETKMVAEAVSRISAKTGRSSDDARDTLAAMSPQRRLVTPDEVAYLVMTLMPDEARGIHGQALVLDGGGVMSR
jgi:NAD(P)-dependent dehydrogenase (short-subunit alcohol dehydrogenase family)